MKKALLAGALAILLCGFAAAQQYQVIYSFKGQNDGYEPLGDLISDSKGNLYGATQAGGHSLSSSCQYLTCGTVFELSPNVGGSWTETILYNFCSSTNCTDGNTPGGALVADSSGNLYGTTEGGGPLGCPGNADGCGVAYELSPPSIQGGPWTYNVLYNFCSDQNGGVCADGYNPEGVLAFDGSGNLYGTASLGGTFEQGTVFELTKGTSGGWTEAVLYDFCSQPNCTDGAVPFSGVALGPSGTMYGTTAARGPYDGVLYKLAPGSGGMTETVLYAFNTLSALAPDGPVTLDSAGNLYTTYDLGGPDNDGGMLAFTKTGKHLLHFGNENNGRHASGIVIDSSRKMAYGVTPYGGTTGNGIIYAINQSRTETVLYNFCQQSKCTDGAYPYGLLTVVGGTIYGTTQTGGAMGWGAVFAITP